MVYNLSKILLDVGLAITGLVLLSPVYLVIATLVKLTSPGPVFYRGIRTGRFGKPFKILKFRSMYLGADEGAGTTSKNDARVTAVGGFIRKFKLDELPQLINVLVGDMSIVGPRPELPRYTRDYKGDELLILTVRPGITDYSSIMFSNLNDLIDDSDPDKSFENKILPIKNRLRIKYVKDRGFFLDLVLIFKTLYKVI